MPSVIEQLNTIRAEKDNSPTQPKGTETDDQKQAQDAEKFDNDKSSLTPEEPKIKGPEEIAL